MEKWEPKEIKLEFATWDLEWYTDAGNSEVKYVDYDDGNERSLYKQFLDEVFNMCESFQKYHDKKYIDDRVPEEKENKNGKN